MKIDVYDTYVTSKKGTTIHFDVLLPSGGKKDMALKFAQMFLEEIGESADSLKQERCNFCHSEIANAAMEKKIQEDGHFILQMEGCPNPL